MSCNLVFNPFPSNSAIGESRKPSKTVSCLGPFVRICCSSSAPDSSFATELRRNNASLTGGAYDFGKATTSLTQKLLSSPKKVTLVRHGYSTWNKEGRVQGSSDLSVLTEEGIEQAERCRTALTDIHFDQCFSSPISRAKYTAEILWKGKEEPLVYLDSLKEAHLYFLEGLKNGSGCQEAISQGVCSMERRSLQSLHQRRLSCRSAVGESSRSMDGNLTYTRRKFLGSDS